MSRRLIGGGIALGLCAVLVILFGLRRSRTINRKSPDGAPNKNYYKRSPDKNPRGPAEGKNYVVRGGAWNSSAGGCRSAYRSGESPGSAADACFARPDIGFRCVRRVAPAPPKKRSLDPRP
jgi:hypothetical protein